MAAMGSWPLLATGLAGVDLPLQGVLTAVWLRNYRTFHSSLVAGLVAFGTVTAENAVAVDFFFGMQSLYSMDPGVQQVVALLRGLQALALAFLTYATVKRGRPVAGDATNVKKTARSEPAASGSVQPTSTPTSHTTGRSCSPRSCTATSTRRSDTRGSRRPR